MPMPFDGIRGLAIPLPIWLLALALSITSVGCKGSFTRGEAIRFTLRHVDLPDKGGYWREGCRTLHLWAKTRPGAGNRGDAAVYRAFSLFIEGSYGSIMSCPAPLDYLRITVAPPKGERWVFNVPFGMVREYFSSAASPDAFWNGIHTETVTGGPWPPSTPELSRGVFTEWLVNGDLIASSGDVAYESATVEWDTKTGWFTAGITYGSERMGMERDATLRIGGIVEARCDGQGLRYEGIRFIHGGPGRVRRVRSYTRGALGVLLAEQGKHGA